MSLSVGDFFSPFGGQYFLTWLLDMEQTNENAALSHLQRKKKNPITIASIRLPLLWRINIPSVSHNSKRGEHVGSYNIEESQEVRRKSLGDGHAVKLHASQYYAIPYINITSLCDSFVVPMQADSVECLKIENTLVPLCHYNYTMYSIISVLVLCPHPLQHSEHIVSI